ncbi:MAG: TonB-dependent receptor [Bacteroidales bacterium]|nr:TonB-dependent receptor [Bacteroidales bacterium]MCF8403489.1 TonB-dependent receptor [Bacteroidales bacterium]
MKTKLTILFLLISPVLLLSQKYTISGYVEDMSNGEKLLGANVYNTQNYEGTITNNYGFYSLTQKTGDVQIRYSYIGYQSQTLNIDLNKDTVIHISLQPALELEEVVIEGSREENALKSSQMSVTELPMNMVKSLPVFFGEVDVMKTIQLLPGVQSGSEGTSGLYVRGGGPDQNLILLDGVPVYNANHLFGFFSVFNADAINTTKLVKGGFPARYGGRLSSVLDIRMKEGNTKEFHGEGSVGLIASKLTLEGPIMKDKSSFIISGRRTYIDILAYPIIAASNTDPDSRFSGGYYFYDLNAKVNHKFSDKSRLYLSAYLGNDKAHAKETYTYGNEEDLDKFKLRWGNFTTVLRWNYMFNPKLFANTRLSYSKYKFLVNNQYKYTSPDETEDFEFTYSSGIDDLAAGIDFDFLPNPKHAIKFGFSNIYHTFNPGVNAFSQEVSGDYSSTIDTTFGNSQIYAHELDIYIEDDFKLGSRIKANAGIHASGFSVKKKFYTSIQPRFSARYLINDKLSVKASYAKMNQYVHLLSNTSIGLPTDLWVPVTDTIKPMVSDQVAIGSVYNLSKTFEIHVEGFYKWMNSLITYKPGASYFLTDNSWQSLITTGKGWSYGAEFLLRKNLGKVTGWIGYTLSWSNRQFDEVSDDIYPYRYDRRHDVSIVAMWKVKENVDIGATWVFGTGNAVTLPYDKYLSYQNNYGFLNSGGGYENYYANLPYIDNVESRNNYRMPAYHRLDLGINFHKETRWGERTWSLGIYNAYFRQNAFFLYVDEYYENGVQKKVLKQVSLFPGIPYVSYSFRF